jgi:predicted dehydrogenase
VTADRGIVGLGVVGAGNISTQYLANLTRFADIDVRFVADLDLRRAEDQAAAYGVSAFGSLDELLAREDVEVVVNLTVPAVHTDIDQLIIASGKHVWSEKPLAMDHASANDVLAAASAAGLRVACAPDTVLGAGIQTGLRAIARGDIGEPLTATTMFHVPGPESWHPNPDFLFAAGAGPLFDMGPYYVTTLVHVFGAVNRVQAVSSIATTSRTIATGPRAGESFPVEVPTHHAALIEFGDGRSAQSTFSFQHAMPRMGVVEINGTEGTIALPDPNRFDGDSLLWRYDSSEAVTLPATGSTDGRGIGVLDLVRSIRSGVPERASGILASHILDVLLGIRDAAFTGAPVDVTSTAPTVSPLPESWDPTAPTL